VISNCGYTPFLHHAIQSATPAPILMWERPMRALAVQTSSRGEHVDRPEGAVPMTELDPKDVLTDLFDSDDLPLPNPEAAAEIVIQRLIDAGFEIKSSR
jgi:hypothetical protein